MKKTRGFTLIELMIVVAVVAILAAVAISQYGKQVRKAKRAEARQNIAAIAMAQEKYRMNNPSYGTCALVLAPGDTCATLNTKLKNYNMAVPTNGANGYSITATPKTTDQLKDECGTFTFTMASGVVTKLPTTPEGCWR
jgi:type IV pilus assembly protein PilE